MAGLEMILEKRRTFLHPTFAPDFSVRQSNRIIDETIEAITTIWSKYHREELSGQTYLEAPKNVRTWSKELEGNSGFYCKVEYMTPISEADVAARIKVALPLKRDVDGLNTIASTELREIAEQLKSMGYQSIS